ncbi:hypothetical protein AKJ54_00195 [candidate division MSBL1 archaeon SCGC-AAA382K21]|uniref:Uncharacterized protein n=1 Tax=candidate division MSBL1 archaeon SCGC-AAA382K21 TaxID=1698283 RepID=A0A133VLY0_9EURY|nr:hypothetical protein AKJ54_00195 [candidate division MSBL1 archaeon SCGC-AAA382K21]
MNERDVIEKEFDEILELIEEEDPEAKEYSVSKNYENPDAEEPTWKKAKIKAKVLVDDVWYCADKVLGKHDVERVWESKDDKIGEVFVDEDAHPYQKYRYGDREYRVYSEGFLKNTGYGAAMMGLTSQLKRRALSKIREKEELSWVFDKFEEQVERLKRGKEEKRDSLLREKYGINRKASSEADEGLEELESGAEPGSYAHLWSWYGKFLEKTGYRSKIGKVLERRNAFESWVQESIDELEEKGFERVPIEVE